MLGLHCCGWVSPAAVVEGSSSWWCVGFSWQWFLCCRAQALSMWDSGAAVLWFSSCSLWAQSTGSVVAPYAPSCSAARGTPQIRDWTCAPCIGRTILNHWTTREALFPFWLFFFCHLPPSPFCCTDLPIYFPIKVPTAGFSFQMNISFMHFSTKRDFLSEMCFECNKHYTLWFNRYNILKVKFTLFLIYFLLNSNYLHLI